MHQWVIAAGLLDFPEIGGLAERAEELLRADLWHAPDVREIFTELYIAFGERLESKAEPLPQTLVSASTGKYVALIGFAPDQAEDMCGVLERLKARALLFESDDPANAGAIQNCDAALVHVRPETLTNSWLRAETPNPSDIRLVLFGSRADLIDLPPATRARAAEFLVDGQDLEETAMRLAFAISRPAELATPPQPVAAPKREPAQSRRTITSPTVVLADDDEIVRTLTGSLLKNHGVTCRSAGNGLDALRLIRSERPAAALLDVNMPGMSGFEVLAAIRAENLPCRVMLLTAREREDDILRGFRLGADDYLTKPFNPFELMARLKRFLQQEEPTASVAKS
ncbi:MAG: response regulator [Ignavibacteriota bacterium]